MVSSVPPAAGSAATSQKPATAGAGAIVLPPPKLPPWLDNVLARVAAFVVGVGALIAAYKAHQAVEAVEVAAVVFKAGLVVVGIATLWLAFQRLASGTVGFAVAPATVAQGEGNFVLTAVDRPDAEIVGVAVSLPMPVVDTVPPLHWAPIAEAANLASLLNMEALFRATTVFVAPAPVTGDCIIPTAFAAEAFDSHARLIAFLTKIGCETEREGQPLPAKSVAEWTLPMAVDLKVTYRIGTTLQVERLQLQVQLLATFTWTPRPLPVPPPGWKPPPGAGPITMTIVPTISSSISQPRLLRSGVTEADAADIAATGVGAFNYAIWEAIAASFPKASSSAAAGNPR